MVSLKQKVSQLLPLACRQAIWYLFDKQYRKQVRDAASRTARLRSAQNEVGKQLLSTFGPKVLHGPFAGMVFFESIRDCVPTHKLLGTYEMELIAVVDQAASTPYDVIVDIGAAEGYYVVGLALRNPTASVVAFEAQPQLHSLIEELATKNNVREQITINGLCDSDSLRSVLREGARTLILCDIEGAEELVLDPSSVAALREADLLVESHDHLAPGVTELLQSRFSATHTIEVIPCERRSSSDWPSDVECDADLAVAAMDECRHENSKWLWMTVSQ